MALLEAVPNFSTAAAALVADLTAAAGREVKILSAEANAGAGRAVITLAGAPGVLINALFSMIALAKEKIDMRAHRGAHPCIGACDVCPLVPLNGLSMAEAVKYSHILGRRLGSELNIPVYLYENSAPKAERRRLEDIRRGGYSHLAEKLASPEWQPDYGPAVFLPRYGATVLGARPPLIAFNVNLATKEVKVAKEIARRIRSSGNGHRPGRLKALKAIGWYIADFDKVQVSMNITDFRETSIMDAFLAAKEEAQKLGTKVTGSELIGLAPRAALPPEWIPLLGLNELAPFDPKKKIIENVLNFE